MDSFGWLTGETTPRIFTERRSEPKTRKMQTGPGLSAHHLHSQRSIMCLGEYGLYPRPAAVAGEPWGERLVT